MNSRDTRTRYLLRMALSLALPLIADEDRKDMEALLHELNGDSWSLKSPFAGRWRPRRFCARWLGTALTPPQRCRRSRSCRSGPPPQTRRHDRSNTEGADANRRA
jgi:hypothetical protein